jgi:hypothetical protein
MYWAGWLFLINTFYLKANQKLISSTEVFELNFTEYKINRFLIILIFGSFLTGMDVLNINENLKMARDESRVKEVNFMSKILVKNEVKFRVGEANSYSNSVRADRGYILMEQDGFNKIINQMRVLYLDSINNETYNYKFKSENGVDFELSAKLESQEYISKYGEIYSVKYLGK